MNINLKNFTNNKAITNLCDSFFFVALLAEGEKGGYCNMKRFTYTQEQIEKLVVDFLQKEYPKFGIKEGMLETTAEDDQVTNWWVSCVHRDGNESIVEDEEIILFLQQKNNWNKVTNTKIVDNDQGFSLTITGE